MVLDTILSLGLLASHSFGFVLLSSADKGKLDATPTAPRIIFVLDPSPPSLKEKDEYWPQLIVSKILIDPP